MTGSINSNKKVTGTISSGGGTTDHNRLTNRDADDQHPISAITGLQDELDSKLDSVTIQPVIEEIEEEVTKIANTKAKGLYYDANKELDTKSYWYVTSEIDPDTTLGTKSSVISGPYDLGAGGGGGGGGGTTEVTILNTNPETGETLWPTSVALNSTVTFGIYWTSLKSGKSTGKGTMYVYVNDNLVSKKAVAQGELSYDLTEYIVSGDNKIEFKVTDAYSTSANIIGNVTGVSLQLNSSFSDSLAYTGAITYSYTPIGDVAKTMHFIVDGIEIGQTVVKTSGELCTYSIPAQTHGAHSLHVYFDATIDGDIVTSNTLKYDLVCYTAGNKTPIIASTFDETVDRTQYVAFTIPYRVYTPGKNYSTVKLYVNGEQVGNDLSVDIAWHSWEYQPITAGTYIFKIISGVTSREFSVHVSKTEIDVQPVTTGLALYLSSLGRSNEETEDNRKQWKDADRNISCSLTGFNWASNGWIKDDDDTTVLRLSGDARVVIPYQPFKNNPTTGGLTIELEMATTDVKDYEARLLECIDGSDSLTHYCTYAGEDTRTKKFKFKDLDAEGEAKFEEKFIAAVSGDHGSYIFTYDGNGNWVMNGKNCGDLLNNPDNEYGIQLEKWEISTETSEGDWEMKGDRIFITYAVTGRGLYVTPSLMKFQSQLSSLSTQYKEDEKIRIAFTIQPSSEMTTTGAQTRLLSMYINGILSGVARYAAGDSFTQTPVQDILIGSNDATIDIYTIRVYSQCLTRKQIVNNWIADTREVVLQATRYTNNNNYNETGSIVVDKLPSRTPYMIITGNSLPTYKGDKKDMDVAFTYPGTDSRCFTATGATMNVQGTSSSGYYKKNFKGKFSNGFVDLDGNTEKKYKINPPLSKKEKTFVFKADVASSEGANNIQLAKYYETTKTYYTPAELDQDEEDTQDGYSTKDRIRVAVDGFPMVLFHRTTETATPTFYGKMNFINDKGNDDTFGFTDGDECWEFINNTTPLVLFQTNDMTSWASSFESRFPETAGTDEHAYGTGSGELTKLTQVVSWIYSTMRTDSMTEAEKTAKLAKFKNELSTYFDVESCLFYYLYSELFLLVDNRAKNAMLAYLHVHNSGDGGNKWFWMPYDLDTAMGTNNEGLLSFSYDVEDNDQVEGANVYNGQASVFWNNLRDAYQSELKAKYNSLRDTTGTVATKWSYEVARDIFENHQAYWSENIFNEDAYSKYLEPLMLQTDASYLGMAQGSKSAQRQWWLYNRFKYLDSKYISGDALGQNIMLRVYQRSDITLTAFINCYLTVRYDQEVMQKTAKVEKGKAVTITPPEEWDPGDSDAVMWLYSADELQDVGDLSTFKPGYANFSMATKLQKIKLGSDTAGYQNDKLVGINVGNNHLLTVLDAKNCTNLGTVSSLHPSESTPAPDLSGCTAIEEVYFDGTQIKGVSLPVGGNLKVLHLPDTIVSLTIRNHPNLTDVVVGSPSSLTYLWLEDIPSGVIRQSTTSTDKMSYFTLINTIDSSAAVRMIDISETTKADATGSASEIYAFYDRLDGMTGLDGNGDPVDTAQVTGKIYIDSISYAEYVELTARRPEIKIIADEIICTVKFYNYSAVNYDTDPHTITYELLDWATHTVIQGKTTSKWPEAQKFGPTVPCEYTFNHWRDEDGNTVDDTLVITRDIEIYTVYDETVRQYTVNFDTKSAIITIDPPEAATQQIDYNAAVKKPTCVGIPETITLAGWYNKDDHSPWIFEDEALGNTPTKVLGDTTIYARWNDPNVPVVKLTRTAYNKVNAYCTDDLGVTAYAITTSEETPTTWTELEASATSINIEATLKETDFNENGIMFFHIKDGNDNTNYDTIKMYPIERIYTEGISENGIHLKEGDSETGTFALAGTTLVLTVDYDTAHYENLVIYLNETTREAGYTFVVEKAMSATATCERQTFEIKFDTSFNGKSKGTVPDPQYKKYKALVDEPLPQYDDGYYVDGWYKTADLKAVENNKWYFVDETDPITGEVTHKADIVEENRTLYAYWAKYSSPSSFTINAIADKTMTVNYTQTDTTGGVEIDWGDGTEDNPDVETGDGTQVALAHTYTESKQYTITVTCKNGSWKPGSAGISMIFPGELLTDMYLAYDVTTFESGAFAGCINLTDITLSRYVVSLPANAFFNCLNLKSINKDESKNIAVEFPVSLVSIGDYAFENCYSLEGKMVLPKNLTKVGRQAFQYCAGLTEVTGGENITDFGLGTFISCTGLTSFEFNTKLEAIPEEMFRACTGLLSIDIPENIKTIGVKAFNECSNLQQVILRNPDLDISYSLYVDRTLGVFCYDPELTSAGPLADATYDEATDTWTYPYAINFAFTKKIPIAFFRGNGVGGLQSVKLPTTLETIEEQAFCYQTNITSIELPIGLTKLGDQAFYMCTSLSGTFEIPNTVRYIGINVLAYARNITTLNIFTESLYPRSVIVTEEMTEEQKQTCIRPSNIEESWVYNGYSDLVITLRLALSEPDQIYPSVQKYLTAFGSTADEHSVAYFASLGKDKGTAKIEFFNPDRSF